MQKRRISGHIVFGLHLLAACLGVFAGCASSHPAPDHHWIPISHSADVVVVNPAETNRSASPPAASLRRVPDSKPPLRDYDRKLIAAVQQRWYDLMDQGSYSFTKGFVTLEFVLMHNGNVSNIQVVKSTLDDKAMAICRKAIQDSAPFPDWPPEIRQQVGDKRTITFSFYFEK